jgi:hypothetical protein
MTLRDFVAVSGLIAALSLASVAGLPEYLGAHPWWAARTGIVGSLIGAACLLALRSVGLKTVPLLWTAATGLALSSAAAVFGKRAFAASFAESALAGRFWFFGWFGVSASFVVLIATVVLYRLRR